MLTPAVIGVSGGMSLLKSTDAPASGYVLKGGSTSKPANECEIAHILQEPTACDLVGAGFLGLSGFPIVSGHLLRYSPNSRQKMAFRLICDALRLNIRIST